MKKLAIASALLSALAITGTAHAYQAEVEFKHVMRHLQKQHS